MIKIIPLKNGNYIYNSMNIRKNQYKSYCFIYL